MKSSKTWVVIFMLAAALLITYVLPTKQFKGTGFISDLQLPDSFLEWTGRDVSEQLNLDFERITYKFISDAVAYQYFKSPAESLLFIILDAGNFHQPQVCYTQAGFEVKELGDAEFQTSDHFVKSHSLFTKKNNESYVSFYWVIIDKEVVHNWAEQKLKQFYFTLSRQKKIGLMVRIDVPAREDTIEEATVLAKQFINELSAALPKEKAVFILGKMQDL